jgi:hypothetical protein
MSCGTLIYLRLATVALFMLAACHSKGTAMKPQDAAHWVHEACGITFAQEPVVLSGSAPAAHQVSSVISATVVLPATEVAAALESLRNNPTLHSRGQSDTRYSYESYPDAGPAKACELDTSMHVLYFRYVD